jgi:hypothetical protein
MVEDMSKAAIKLSPIGVEIVGVDIDTFKKISTRQSRTCWRTASCCFEGRLDDREQAVFS